MRCFHCVAGACAKCTGPESKITPCECAHRRVLSRRKRDTDA